MKQLFISALSLLVLVSSCKEKIVYKDRPILNDSTVLKAHFKASEWNMCFNTIFVQSTKLASGTLDSTGRQRAKDTLQMVSNFIIKGLNDTTLNPIFKKEPPKND